MNAASYVGRVGRLAVALGVGIAVATGYGATPAWAETPSTDSVSTNNETSDKTDDKATAPTDTSPEPSASDGEPGDADGESDAALDDDLDIDLDDLDDEDLEPEPESEPEPKNDSLRTATTKIETPAPKSALDAPEARIEADEPPDNDSVAFNSVAPQTLTTTAEAGEETQTTLSTLSTLVTPSVPSLRPWPTAFDPTTAVTYVTGLVTSLVSAALSPFAAGLPGLPTEPPSLWTLLAWVRRELFNGSPTIDYHPEQTTQSLVDGEVLIQGNLGAADPDGDPLTYTVIGRPLNGGVVSVDENGNFTYRPMNAMAAVGGVDQFIVLVSDEAAGLHNHGVLGLAQFVPILGQFVNAGGGHAVAKTITVQVEPVAGVDLSFPDNFHWGVAHAGFQAEGGPGSPVDPNSDWYKWVHDPINQLLGFTNGVPEDGPGTYVRYDEDAALARDELGMNTFRFGIEWSRIFPNSTAGVDISDEGGVITLADLQALDALADQDEVAHYAAVLDSLRAHGLEPMVTVTHFTLPSWVHDPTTTRILAQLGLPASAAGWLSPDTPVEFQKYAAYLAWKYGDKVDNWATLNEPFPPVLTQFFAIPGLIPAWPPGVLRPDLASTFLVNQARAHVAAYDAIHAWDTTVAKQGDPDAPAAFVGFTNNMLPARPANPANPLDVAAADAWNRMYNQWFPNAVIDGWVDANLDGIKTLDEIHPEFVGKTDFLGVQYYGSDRMQGLGFAPIPGLSFFQGIPMRCQPTSSTCSDFNQPIDPGGFREVLELAASYGKPLWVTENGIADADDAKRPPYLVNHIAVVQDLVAHGTDIRGYTYWSFVDNLEWAEGYHLRFGLYGSDPTTPELERIPKPDSIAAISAITKSGDHSLPLLLLQQYLPGAAG